MSISDQHHATALLNSIDPLQAAAAIQDHITATHMPDVTASITAKAQTPFKTNIN